MSEIETTKVEEVKARMVTVMATAEGFWNDRYFKIGDTATINAAEKEWFPSWMEPTQPLGYEIERPKPVPVTGKKPARIDEMNEALASIAYDNAALRKQVDYLKELFLQLEERVIALENPAAASAGPSGYVGPGRPRKN